VQGGAAGRAAPPASVEINAGVVGEVRAHARQVDQDTDPECVQVGCRPDARPQQDRRRAVRPGGQDDPPRPDLRSVRQPDRDGAVAVEHHARNR
jgi:hypothetical protein